MNPATQAIIADAATNQTLQTSAELNQDTAITLIALTMLVLYSVILYMQIQVYKQ